MSQSDLTILERMVVAIYVVETIDACKAASLWAKHLAEIIIISRSMTGSRTSI